MSSTYGLYPVVSSSIDGDSIEYGVNDFKLLFRLFNGVDIDKPVKISTKWAFEIALRQKPIANPTADIDYGQWFVASADSNKPKYIKPDGTVIDLSTGAPDASTSVKGIVELAEDLESAADLVVQSNDTRLSDARTPLSHSHLLADLPNTLVVTSDSRLSDARTPTTHTHVKADIPSAVAYEDESNTFANSQKFEDFQDQKVITPPSDPASGYTRRYSKQINANNDATAFKQKVNGSVVEILL